MSTFVRGAALSLAVWTGGAALASGQPSAAERGREAFNTICALCHGSEGKGDAGPALVPLQYEYREILGIVRDGYGQMPPISSAEVSDEQVADIVEYLKALTAQASSPGPEPQRSTRGRPDRPAPAIEASWRVGRAPTQAAFGPVRE